MSNAHATIEPANVPMCTLSISRRQAEALAAVLVLVEPMAGFDEGAELHEVYDALVAGGAETDAVGAELRDGWVAVWRDDVAPPAMT